MAVIPVANCARPCLMPRFLSFLFIFLPLVALLAGCVGQTYRPPPPVTPQIAAFEADSLEDAIGMQTARLVKAHQLLWPLLVANEELCKKTRLSIGVLVSDRVELGKNLRGITAGQLALVGVPDYTFALSVMKGGPAEAAGLRDGDQLLGVDAKKISDPDKLREALSRQLGKKEAPEKIDLLIARNGIEQNISVAPIRVCDAALRVNEGDVLNAYAGTKTITLYAGLMRIMDEQAVQYVLAHELAHVGLGHVRKGVRNAVVSGALVYVPILSALGSGADSVLDRFDPAREISLGSKALGLLPSLEAFEAEADYVGLYMLARADLEMGGAVRAFEIFSREKPQSIWVRYTHPLTPERMQAAEAAIAEIDHKRQTGATLLPNKIKP